MTLEQLQTVLRRQRVTHLVGLPDNTSGPLLNEPAGFKVVAVTREGEAFAIAAGLWVGGARPVVVIQNTGLLESGDALRGTAARMGVPLPCLVTLRGAATISEPPPPSSRATLTDPAIDSVALLTEPTLRAWGIPASRVSSPQQLERMFQDCSRRSFPAVALLQRLEHDS